MGLALEFLLNLFDPFHIIRRHFWNPFKTIAANVFDHFMNKTQDKVSTIRDVILRIGFVAFMVALIIWSAIFMYVTFYYAYMPAMSHTRPVHMQFKTCLDQGGPCSFPHAHVSLTKKQQLLMMGQAYRVQVIIDMPESIQNQELGMFMVCGELRDQESYLRGHACRTALMKYKSHLIRTISTWSLGPLYILGLKEEHERIYVEIFPRYLEERNHPITDVYIEIQSHKIQFYSVTLQITADFTD
uniref:Seipin n=1 Tax=Megaselia scalaris TaxID=36166 RepID=T1GGZ0_MEGSC